MDHSSNLISKLPSWQRRGLSVLIVAVLISIPFITGGNFHFHIAIMVCLGAMAVSGLAVIAWVGQLSLAQGAFVGLGAYTSTLIVMRLGAPFFTGPLAACVLAGLTAAAIGTPLLRLRGVYFVLITFALNELFRLVMLEFPSISGGSSGIPNIPLASFGSIVLNDKSDFYILVLICLAAVLGVLWLIDRGLLGRQFAAIEENVALAEASGIPTARMQAVAFIVGSSIAGFTGGLMAHYIGFVSPETFGFLLSVSYIIMLVVGGRLALWGGLTGAIFLTPLPELLRGAVEYQHIIYGITLIVVLQFLPEGLVSLPARLANMGRSK